MQNGKEGSVGFVKDIIEKVRDWKSRHLWVARIFVYALFFLLYALVFRLEFAHFNLFHTDASSARYMLSALVQSQAAIIAIVISLTLIAVQLTASAYSPRVIDIFKKNPDMWILLGCYGVSMYYGLIILKLVEGVEGEVVSQSAIGSLGVISISLEFCVSIAYWFGAFTFVILIPYVWNIMDSLKPESVINRLEIEITKDKIINSEENPIQPITDIVCGAIIKYDLETTRVGLNVVTEQVLEIIDPDDEEKISEHFCSHLTRVGRLAISREDEDSTVEVIKCLAKFGESTAEKELKVAISKLTKSLGGVGGDAVKKGLEFATSEALNYLGKVGIAAAKNKLEDATKQAAAIIEFIGKKSAEKGLEDATWEAVKFLGEVGVAAAKQDLKDVTSQAVTSLEEVGKSATEKRLYGATKSAAMCLGNVGEAAAEKGLEDATKWAAICLGEFGVRAAEKRLEGATRRVAESLEEVGKAAVEKRLEDATSRAAMSLVVVGTAYVKNSLEGATEQVAKSLGLEDTTERLARSLAELTILSKEIVKTAIQNYESNLKGQPRDSFQKFMKIYEQELEKLQAEKR